MEWWGAISSILVVLFGGLNIFQLLTFRAYKRQRNAEADRAEIENLKSVIETVQTSMKNEIDRLNAKVEKADRRFYEQTCIKRRNPS